MKMHFIKTTAFALAVFCFTAANNVNAQNRAYTATDSQVQYLLNRIETRTDTFRTEMSRAIDTSRLNNTDAEDSANNYVADFENATDALKQKFGARDSVDADVQDVLSRAAFINQFLQNNRLTTGVQNNWNYIRTDLNTMARYYGITGNWMNPMSNGNTNNGSGVGSSSRLPYSVPDNTLRTLLVRIQTRTDTFKSSVDRALNRTGAGNSTDITGYISEFQTNTSRLQENFDARRSGSNDVQELLNSASSIDQFVRANRLNPAAQRDWTSLRADINQLATYYNVSWNPNSTTNNDNRGTGIGSGSGTSYRVADRDVQTLIARLETRTDAYKRDVGVALDRSILNNTRSEDSISSYITEFENATDRLKQNFDARRSTSADVEEVLNRAYFIDSFMRDYRLTTGAESQWRLVRTDLDTLTNYYNVTWNWNRQYSPASRFDSMLTGTYRLNVAQSDSVGEVVSRAVTSYYPGAQGARVRNNLERRLTSPDSLVIEKRGSQVTVASSAAPQVTFNADGVARTETTGNGRAIKITANSTYDGVALNYEGDRVNDFYVNFIPMSNGQLKVIRRVYLDNRNDTVTVASIYDKTDTNARFTDVNNNNNNGQNTGSTTDFVVPNNTNLRAVLRSQISTKTSQNGDRFQMEVTSPSEFNGAVIEGRVTNTQRSGTVSGRANLALEFDTIRLRNGSTYRFAGIVDQVTLASGEKVMVNNEGAVRDNNQTTKTVTRAGIGAALGALIGAIAGGGQGAAIGAVVGAGAGAGSVILQGRDDVELTQGTEVLLTASAPNNVNR